MRRLYHGIGRHRDSSNLGDEYHLDRPAKQAMLELLRKQREHTSVVTEDVLSASSLERHWLGSAPLA